MVLYSCTTPRARHRLGGLPSFCDILFFCEKASFLQDNDGGIIYIIARDECTVGVCCKYPTLLLTDLCTSPGTGRQAPIPPLVLYSKGALCNQVQSTVNCHTKRICTCTVVVLGLRIELSAERAPFPWKTRASLFTEDWRVASVRRESKPVRAAAVLKSDFDGDRRRCAVALDCTRRLYS